MNVTVRFVSTVEVCTKTTTRNVSGKGEKGREGDGPFEDELEGARWVYG